MTAETDTRPAPRERLLETAAELFYAEGLRAVGVDRLIAAAGVTKATFYRHFPAKDDLVLAYLAERDQRIRSQVAQGETAAGGAPAALALLVDGLGQEICGPGFRGCAFINAAAEYPDPDHPVRRLVAEHRDWFRDTLATLAAGVGHPDPAAAAGMLMLLRDGAMVGGYLDGDRVRVALAQAVLAVLGPVPGGA